MIGKVVGDFYQLRGWYCTRLRGTGTRVGLTPRECDIKPRVNCMSLPGHLHTPPIVSHPFKFRDVSLVAAGEPPATLAGLVFPLLSQDRGWEIHSFRDYKQGRGRKSVNAFP